MSTTIDENKRAMRDEKSNNLNKSGLEGVKVKSPSQNSQSKTDTHHGAPYHKHRPAK
jgi:hypothetical protein